MYPNIFYYEDEAQDDTYSTNPQGGTPDINRLAMNQPDFWRSANLTKQKKQKQIILNDWTWKSWSYEKRTEVQKIVSKLIDDGFKVYIWQGEPQNYALNGVENARGNLKKLNQDNLYYMLNNSNQDMSLAPTSTIINTAAKEHSLVKNQIFILDNDWLNCLLKPTKNLPQPKVYISALNSLTQDEIPNVLTYLKSTAENLEIIIDECSDRTTANLPIIKKQIGIKKK